MIRLDLRYNQFDRLKFEIRQSSIELRLPQAIDKSIFKICFHFVYANYNINWLHACISFTFIVAIEN